LNDKGNSRNWEKIGVIIGVIISIISLSISIYSSIFLTNRSLELAAQANELTERSLELQNMLLNFTPIITVNPERGFLSQGGYYSIGVESAVYPYGYLNVSVTVTTPHYGVLSIEEGNFSPYSDMLNPERINSTTVSYYSQYDKYERSVYVGIDQLEFNLNLKAIVYPNPQKLQPQNESEFPLGVFFLKAKLVDAQTNKTFTNEFSTVIFVTIKTF
jgi:hypothetical protein